MGPICSGLSNHIVCWPDHIARTPANCLGPGHERIQPRELVRRINFLQVFASCLSFLAAADWLGRVYGRDGASAAARSSCVAIIW